MDYFRSGPAGEDSASGSPKLSSGTNGTSNKRRVEEDGRELMEVFENERYRDQIGWSAKNLELDDPKNFSWAGGGADTFISPPLPSGYEYLGIWWVTTNCLNIEESRCHCDSCCATCID